MLENFITSIETVDALITFEGNKSLTKDFVYKMLSGMDLNIGHKVECYVIEKENHFETVKNLDKQFNIDANLYDPNGTRYKLLNLKKLNNAAFFPEETRVINPYLFRLWQRNSQNFVDVFGVKVNDDFDLLRKKPDLSSALCVHLINLFIGRRTIYDDLNNAFDDFMKNKERHYGNEFENINSSFEFCVYVMKTKSRKNILDYIVFVYGICEEKKLDKIGVLSWLLFSLLFEEEFASYLSLWNTLLRKNEYPSCTDMKYDYTKKRRGTRIEIDSIKRLIIETRKE